MKKIITLTLKSIPLCCLILVACSSPKAGPDKTVGGAVLGAAWGAGAGAIVGNQLTPGRTGEGAAVGAGVGIVSGALQGAGYDQVEDELLVYEEEIEDLRIRNMANGQQIANLQARLDGDQALELAANVYQVFFESDATNLKSGSINNLEQIADQFINNSRISKVYVVGHTDETGDDKYNIKLSKERAESVAAYLKGRGISNHQIIVSYEGANKPIATNNTAEGKQLNRRVDVTVSLN